ncbi:MAG: DUF3179 domain-containing (seleno)protein [Candidatus Kariarchaeaceae archaeon]|jgi:hypothetical protein
MRTLRLLMLFSMILLISVNFMVERPQTWEERWYGPEHGQVTYDYPEVEYNSIPSQSLQLADSHNCSVPCGFILPVLSPDRIPSIDEPKFLSSDEAELSQEEIVLGIVQDGIAHAFPLDILDWHEIVNTQIGDAKLAVTYCPLTATGILYDRANIDGSEIGTSGNLYENNLVFYDRDTSQYWLQMYGEVIEGDPDQLGRSLDRLPIMETTWRAWSAMHPDTLVLSRDTGYYAENAYDRVAYPGYDTREDIIFRSSYDFEQYPDNLHLRKQRTLIIDNQAGDVHLYPFPALENYSVVNDVVNDVVRDVVSDVVRDSEPIVIVYDDENRLAIPFYATLTDGTVLTGFEQSAPRFIGEDSYDLPVFEDDSGTRWNFKGEALSGEHKGAQLQQLAAYTGYWFAAVSMYPDAKVFPQDTTITPQDNRFDWTGRYDESDAELTTVVGIGLVVAIIVATVVIIRRSAQA